MASENATLGIVWIPGVMAGMVLAGSDPILAAICMLFVRRLAFSSADQLTLRMVKR